MKYAPLLVMLVCFSACNNASQTEKSATADSSAATIKAGPSDKYIHTFSDTALETRITEALMKLPFVKKSDAYIDSFSNHTHGIAFMMEEQKENEVSVRAGYNGGERFETYYHFIVDPKTMDIKVYDPVEDKTLTLKEYLNTR
ncbi:MAG: hypothetical protein JNM14_08015 [Ferruginibacter sp.]|nr:hypothetical protein [Ferruginibacter sp.]